MFTMMPGISTDNNIRRKTMKKYVINYPALPILAITFTRGKNIVSRGIQFFRKGLLDKAFPNHAFLITSDHGQLFATEETAGGLAENSLELYTKNRNKIVAMYRWVGFSDTIVAETAETYLAEIRRRRTEESRYDFKGLLSFIPGIKKFFKPDPRRQWCSENVASILKRFGCPVIDKIEIAPDQLKRLCEDNPTHFVPVLDYYKEA